MVESTRLFGRDEVVAELAARVRGPGLVTLFGPPGIGKTSVGRAIARRRQETREPTTWLDLEGVPADFDLAHVARRLTPRSGLLILDHPEERLQALCALRSAWPELGMLVLSQVWLETPEEERLELEPLSACATVAMLEHALSIRGVRGARALLEGPEGRRLVELVDGNPALIEGVAGELVTRGLAPVLGDLTAVRDRSPGTAGLTRAHLRGLGVEDHALLGALAVFRGGFDQAAAEACTGTPLDEALPRLARRSALRVLHQMGRYEVHRVVTPAPTADVEVLRARHAVHFSTLALAELERVEAGADRAALARLAVERENLEAALTWAAASGEWALVLSTALALAILHRQHDRPVQASQALDLALASTAGLVHPLRARALMLRAGLVGAAGDTAVREDLRAAIHAAQELGDLTLEARARGLLACDLAAAGDPGGARQSFHEATRLAAGTVVDLGRLRYLEGLFELIQFRPEAAEPAFAEACRLLRAAGNRHEHAQAQAWLCDARIRRGVLTSAETLAELRAVADEFEDRHLVSLIELYRSRVCMRERDSEGARRHGLAALAAARRRGDLVLEGTMLVNQGLVELQVGRIEDAQRCFEEALSVDERIGDLPRTVLLSGLLASIDAAYDLVEQASERLDRAQRRLAAFSPPDDLFACFLELQRGHVDLAVARRAASRGEQREAVAALESARRRLAKAESAGSVWVPTVVDRWIGAAVSAALLRRALESPPTSPTGGAVVLDHARARVVYPGGVVEFARRRVLKEFLFALASAAGEVVSKEALARTLFTCYQPARHDAALRVNIGRLRAALLPTGIGVAFEAGGYCLVTPPGFAHVRSLESQSE